MSRYAIACAEESGFAAAPSDAGDRHRRHTAISRRQHGAVRPLPFRAERLVKVRIEAATRGFSFPMQIPRVDKQKQRFPRRGWRHGRPETLDGDGEQERNSSAASRSLFRRVGVRPARRCPEGDDTPARRSRVRSHAFGRRFQGDQCWAPRCSSAGSAPCGGGRKPAGSVSMGTSTSGGREMTRHAAGAVYRPAWQASNVAADSRAAGEPRIVAAASSGVSAR